MSNMEDIMKVRQELFELQNLNAYISNTGKYQIRSAYVEIMAWSVVLWSYWKVFQTHTM